MMTAKRHCQWLTQRGYCGQHATKRVVVEPKERGYANVDVELCTVHSRFVEDGRCSEGEWVLTEALSSPEERE